MSDKNTNEPQERKDYMRDTTDNQDHAPDRKEGLEEPKVKELNKVKIGLIIFMIIVLIILAAGIGFDMFGLME